MAMFAVLDNGKLTEDYPENIPVFFCKYYEQTWGNSCVCQKIFVTLHSEKELLHD